MESNLDSVLNVLDQLGIEYKKDSNRAKVLCPWHDEKTPSCVVYDTNSVYCFGCQKRAWHDEFIAKLCNCSVLEAKKKLGTYDPNLQYIPRIPRSSLENYEMSEPPKDFSDSWEKLPHTIPRPMYDWMKSKGLESVGVHEGLWRWLPKRTFKCWDNREGICIPYFGPNGEVSTFRLRVYDRMRERFTHEQAPKGIPLQPSYYVSDTTKPVYFCEGNTDTLAIVGTGNNAICLPGVGAHKQLHSAIMQCLEWKIPTLIFCGDNDDAGRLFNAHAQKAAIVLGMGLFTPQIRILKLPDEYNKLPEGGFKRKDLNDFWVEGRLKDILQTQDVATPLPSFFDGAEEISMEDVPF